MNAFITGSHAYGTPNEDSDVDLVVRMSKTTLKKLYELSGTEEGEPLRFGNLNLIVCTNDLEMAVWKFGTASLITDNNPYHSDKKIAKMRFDDYRRDVGLEDRSQSG